MEPNILVLDEPTANLDPRARLNIIELIKSFSHSCLIITQDLEMVWDICKRTIILKDGKILADGNTKEIFMNKELIYRSGLEQPYQIIYGNK